MKKRGLFFNKKGITHQQLTLLAELVIPIIMLVVLLAWVNDVTSNRFIDKNFYTRDIAMTASTLYINPYNAFYVYHFNDKMNFDLNENSLEVSFEDDKFSATHYFWRDKSIDYEDSDKQKIKTVYIVKEGSEFFSGEKADLKIKEINCPDIKTNKINSVIFDPLDFNPGKDILLDIASSSRNKLGNSISSKDLTRDIGVVRDTSTIYNYDFYIGFRYGQQGDYFNIYYSLDNSDYLKSKKLGCMIANKVMSEINTSFNLIGVNPLNFNAAEQEFLLLNNKGIIIEVGNLNDATSMQKLEGDSSFISSKISEAIKNYDK